MAGNSIGETLGKQDWLAPSPIHCSKRSDAHSRRRPPGLAVKDFLHGVWLGHPLHPALVDVPLGAWTVALTLDALESLSGRDELGPGADAAVAIGLAGAIGAAATGAVDWQATDDPARRVGLVHGLLNSAPRYCMPPRCSPARRRPRSGPRLRRARLRRGRGVGLSRRRVSLP